MRLTSSGERGGNLGNFNCVTFTCQQQSSSVWYLLESSWKGCAPLQANLYSTTPKENTSILELPALWVCNSGAMQRGVPFRDRFWVRLWWSTLRENPKSAILNLPLWRRMFSGLMSRCTKCASYRTRQPLANSRRNRQISYYEQLMLLFMQTSKDPPLQYSMIRQKLCSLLTCSFRQLARLSWQGTCLRILISLRMVSLFSGVRGMILATSSREGSSFLQARTTRPKLPVPISSYSHMRKGVPSRTFTLIFFFMLASINNNHAVGIYNNWTRTYMGEIDFTNIIVDDFRKGKLNPFNKYIYILTHIHTDHLRGLTNSWNYGPIYCTHITANLIMNRYPNLRPCVRPMELEQPYRINLAENIHAIITLFDSNHCAGAAMVLLEGYFGTFLYTGDFRFDEKKFRQFSYLYPPQKLNDKFEGCSKQIDKMWMDNTFCNPRFDFLAQKEALSIVLDFVKNTDKRIYVGMDHYGKEQVLVHIARELNQIIVVNEQRYESIIAMEFDRELFTTNPAEGRIEVIPKPTLHARLQEEKEALGLVMSGWCLRNEWRKVKGTQQLRVFYVPYSLHSNFKEIVAFVKSIKPSIIQPIVSMSDEGSEETQFNVEGNSQAFDQLVRKYTSPISELFMKNTNDMQFQQSLKKQLGIDRKTAEINKKQLGMDTVHMPARGKGYKLSTERDEQQIRRVKESYQRSREKRMRRNKQIVIESDSEGHSNDSSVEVIENNRMQNWAQKASQKNAIMEQIVQQKASEQKISQINDKKVEKVSKMQVEPLQRPDVTSIHKMVLVTTPQQIREYIESRVQEMLGDLQ